MDLNSKLYQSILEVAHKAAKIPGIKALLKPIYYPFKNRVMKNQRKKLMKNGVRILQRFDKVMEENHIEYTLAFGTLLGAIREKGFIKHDFDIDVCIWGDQYSPQIPAIMKSAGFELVRSFVVEEGRKGREETYKCEDVALDIFYVYEDDGENPYYCAFGQVGNAATFGESMRKYGELRVRRVDMPMGRERAKAPFEGVDFYIPTNVHPLLRALYGDDYMIPNPGWAEDPQTFDWKDWSAVYYEA